MTAFKTPSSVREAIGIQQAMREKVVLEDRFGEIATIAGVDVGYDKKNDLARAAIVTMTFDDLHPLEQVVATDPPPFPYVPGLLSFREVPVILKALAMLKTQPDLLFVDGQGVAHPRRLGIAAHIGVTTDLPAIGVAKSRLCGSHEEPASGKGSSSVLRDKGEKIGVVYRSRDRVKPLFISPGHRVSHDTALQFVERCLTRYRLPEPTRLADKLSKTPKDAGQGTLL